ncbi:MAG: AIR synthase related protein [Candidatus Liptonbacteria bacterium]|nr:AIR synthase related protein [Candidatus Liptonbacteria bacterium]
MKSEYADAGVDPNKIDPFKNIMKEMGKRTLRFPLAKNVAVDSSDHGAVWEYVGNLPHIWSGTQEGLGNKNWIAEWMYQHDLDSGLTYYEGIGIDAAMMAVNDLIAQGADPVVYMDEVAAGDSDWFADEKRATALAESYYRACEMAGMALPAGESPSLRYLVKAEPPVKSAPSLSGSVIGIIAPKSRWITGDELCVGDHILGATSSGLHANGISLVIKKALGLPAKFFTKLPNGNTLGKEALIPTTCYVELVNALLKNGVNVRAFLPGTGDGVAKLTFDKRPFTYHVHSWVDVPQIFQFMRELGVSLEDCLTTFNWGIGYYAFVPSYDVSDALAVGRKAGYDFRDIGIVREGERKVVFGPEHGIELFPKAG